MNNISIWRKLFVFLFKIYYEKKKKKTLTLLILNMFPKML